MGLDLARVDRHLAVELGAGIALQRAPIGDRRVPKWRARCELATAQVFNRHLVDRHHAGARACFDGHVAHRHAAFHGQRANRAAGELDRIAGAARGADAADDRQHHVLRRDAARKGPLDVDAHVLHLLGDKALRREHMLDLRGADAVREAGKGAVRARVRVAAHHGHAGKGRALLRPDHMDDALALVEIREVHLGAELSHVGVERFDLQLGEWIAHAREARFPVRSRRVVVGGCHDRPHAPRLARRGAQPVVGLCARHLVDKMAIDVKERRTVVLGVDEVASRKGFAAWLVSALRKPGIMLYFPALAVPPAFAA